MLTKIFNIVLLTLVVITPVRAEWSPYNKLSERKNTTIYVASMQFPSGIKQLPDIRAYFGGYKVNCEKDGDRILFTISADRNTRKLYLLVVENSSFETEEKTNTIKYLKIKPSDAYKLWSLELMHKKSSDVFEKKIVGGIKLNSDEKSPYFWIVNEETILDNTGRIPDNTLIIVYDPKLIDHLEDGLEANSSIALPKLFISSKILNLSAGDLEDLSTRYLLSALDCDAIHARCEYEVTHHPTANRITVTTT